LHFCVIYKFSIPDPYHWWWTWKNECLW